VGLIARRIEAAGIPTLSMSSALSITQAIDPPRAVFLDYPLGHTAGKPHDREDQLSIVGAALRAFAEHREPGQVTHLPNVWSESDDWKDAVMRPAGAAEDSGSGDWRTQRYPTPQYQCEQDRELAQAAMAAGRCRGCVWLEPPPDGS
jgi:hypothetical protein